VFTDKLVAKIPSTHDGVIKSIKYKNDEMCLVGHALIEIEVDEGNDATPAPAQAAKKEEESSSSSSSSDEG
jgi:pyruvate/2-oxoglutarate dehydrogenase complex dihydrolipoamide acyltransferase (E2) component